MRSRLVVADNTGAKMAKMIGVIGKPTRFAHVGDIITCNVREASPTGSVKKGEVVTAVVVRTRQPVRRADGSYLRFDHNAVACFCVNSSSSCPTLGAGIRCAC